MGESTVTIKHACLIVGFICLKKFQGRIHLLFTGISGQEGPLFCGWEALVFVFGYVFLLSRFLGCVLGRLVSIFKDDFRVFFSSS